MAGNKNSVVNQSLIRLTWPIFIDVLFVFLISVVDAWFLSRVSDTAAASVGAILPVTGLCFTLFLNLATAGKSIACQRLGAEDDTALPNTYGALLAMALVLGLVVTALMATMAPQLAQWMGLEGEMAAMGGTYLRILGFGACLLALRYAAGAVLASQGMTSWNMWSTAIMTVANLVLDYAFVYGKFGAPALGVAGVAIASCLAWALSLLFSLGVIFFVSGIKVRLPTDWFTFKDSAKPILRIGVPLIAEPMSWHLSQLVIVAMVVQLGGLVLATRVYASNILFVVALLGTALSAGVQLKVAHCVGAQRYTAAHELLFQGLKMGLASAVTIVAVLFLLSNQLFGLFTTDPAIKALGSSVVAVAVFCEIGRMLNLVVGASLKAAGDAKYVSFFGVAIMWLLAVPLAWLFAFEFGLGLIGIWLAMSADELVRGTLALCRWNSRKWESKGIYANKKPAMSLAPSAPKQTT